MLPEQKTTTPQPGSERQAALPIVRTVADLRSRVAAWRSAGERIALVPTMGALHDGHLSLMRQGRETCDRVVATIFVNPKQFNRAEDLDSYPRDSERDIELLAGQGVDLLYMPEVGEIYPDGFATVVSLPSLSDCLCGAHRPGHFDGVSTVVSKLLLQALPDVALFGEKDFQQLQIIRRMVRDLNIPVTIEGGATVREADGLALSSRNRLLSDEERERAASLFRTMSAAAEAIGAGDEVQETLEHARRALLAAGFTALDYFEVRDEARLALYDPAAGTGPFRLFAAVWLGSTRIIDNLPLTLSR